VRTVGDPSHVSSVIRTDAAVDLGVSRDRRRRLPPVLLAVIAGAWAIAIVAEATGRAAWVHHHELVEGRFPLAASLVLFLVAWQVHVAAMMLPSSLPLIALFGRAASRQPRPRAARAAFLGRYLLIWTVFGVAALGADALLHVLVDRAAWLREHPNLLGGNVLLLAGAFQFTALKDRCLQQCRHPALFLTTHYQRGVRAAFSLGRRHGLFCLGCCWALMLVMFSVGIANLAWMAPLALLMVVEKTSTRVDVTVPVGLGLLGLGVLVLADVAWLPDLLGPHVH
jgi:predicted metal-binding membrane protein